MEDEGTMAAKKRLRIIAKAIRQACRELKVTPDATLEPLLVEAGA